MRRFAYVLVVAGVMGGGLVLCTQCSTPDTTTPPTTAPDAIADVLPPVDRSIPDSRVDPPIPDAGPGWKWFAGFGRSCPGYSVPIDPVAVLPPLTDIACVKTPYISSTSACTEWDTTTWSTPVGAALLGGAKVSTDGKYLQIVRLKESSGITYEEQDVLYDRATSVPLAGFRFRQPGGAVGGQFDRCLMSLHTRGSAGPFLFAFNPSFGFAFGSPAELMDLTAAELMDLTAFSAFSPAYTPHPDVAQDLSASNTTLAFKSLGTVVRLKRNDNTWVYAKSAVAAPVVLGDDVLVRDANSGWYRLSRVEANGDVTVVREVANTNVVGATLTDGFLYWMQLSGTANPRSTQPHFELWRTTYTRDLATFNGSAEKLAEADGDYNFGFSLVFDGVFTTGFGKTALVVRLSDRRVLELNIAAGVHESWPYYVDQNQLWVRYTYPLSGNAHYARLTLAW